MALSSIRQVLNQFRHQPLLLSLAALGGLTAAYSTYQLAGFFHLHFLHRGKLHKYKDGRSQSWALVTGASDGLGRGFAEELLSHGFNVVLHGRKPSKLERVKTELLTQWPDRQIQVLVLNAMLDVEDSVKMSEMAKALETINLKILINNVAGEIRPLFAPHAERTAEQNRKLMNGNAIFASEMTRLLLPQLIKNKPSLIINVGSGSARLPCPYIAIPAAAKTFLESFSHALAVEMVAEGHPEVEVVYQLVGLCSTGSEPRPVTMLVPSSRQYAKSSLGLVGCGYRTVWGYWPHALQFETLFKLPHAVIERICIDLVRQMVKEEEAKRLE